MTDVPIEDVLVFGLPGLSISPADTDTASVRLRIVAAHIWRKVLIFSVAPEVGIQKFCKHTRAGSNLLARVSGTGVRFARSLP